MTDYRIDVNTINTGQRECGLLIASEMGYPEITKLLLLHNQTFVNQKSVHGLSALTMAIIKFKENGLRKYFRIVKLLIMCPKLT